MKTAPALLVLALGAVAPAQSITPSGSRSDQIMLNVAKLDVLVQLTPLTITKEQFGPLLLAIEKIRQKQKELRGQEDKDLQLVEAKLAKAVDDGTNKGTYPPRELQVEVSKLMSAMRLRRNLAALEWTDTLYGATKSTFNAGQLKVMEKSLKPELMDPSIKVESMDAEAKIKFFIRNVFLDPAAYDVLIQMSKKKD